MKIVPKPWGREIWVALNDKYCFKRIELKKGFLTSLQYHKKKEEHIYIHSGKAILTFQVKEGELLTEEVGPGRIIHNKPLEVHRLEALEDLVFYEVSTPEVDDVVRLEDGYGREGTSTP